MGRHSKLEPHMPEIIRRVKLRESYSHIIKELQLNCSVVALSKQIAKARLYDPDIPFFGKMNNRYNVVLTTDVTHGLSRPAMKRDISINALVKELLLVIVKDKLVDAILDDGQGQTKRSQSALHQ